ncbi:MAG: transposase [Okeania sp. SIO3C4]|nr:transposase [Okeania sp. SIO3C4]
MVVLMQDECHLLWGDTCGYNWLKKNQKVEIPMTNFRERQTYYGAYNLFTGDFVCVPYAYGNGECTVDFLEKICQNHQNQRILMLWDGASYHKSGHIKDFLKEVNAGLEEKDWKLTLMQFAPHAPEQNPVEDIWLKAKNEIRRNFQKLTSFAKVKKAFMEALNHSKFQFPKCKWYYSF